MATLSSSGSTFSPGLASRCLNPLVAPVGVIVRATAVCWLDEAFPGWIEVAVIDRLGREHRIREKVPVLTTLPVTSGSAFPFEMWLGADMTRMNGDDVEITLKHGVETVDGSQQLVVAAADVVWL